MPGGSFSSPPCHLSRNPPHHTTVCLGCKEKTRSLHCQVCRLERNTITLSGSCLILPNNEIVLIDGSVPLLMTMMVRYIKMNEATLSITPRMVTNITPCPTVYINAYNCPLILLTYFCYFQMS